MGQGHGTHYRASGTNHANPAAEPPVKSSPDRDTNSLGNRNRNVRKDASMVCLDINLKVNAETCFRSRLAAVALSGCMALTATVHGPNHAGNPNTRPSC